MEQTVNTWSKGLQMDTNPMVLGNDTLTNALNATFITMNSNEVILQNDMGNRRVDSAFLPAGYEPVGIKEYGGIIYIASYNPITNKCLIGSFPSPQLNYGNVENIGATINESFFKDSFKEDKFGDIKFLKNFFILSPFREEGSTKDLILHSGDKFCVYFNGIEKEEHSFKENSLLDLKDLLTNYDNIYIYDKTKLYSPKNKKYTLQLGILNSLNEFVDFTSSLLRWDENDKIIKFDNDTPDYIKFNTGYFIPNSFNSIDLTETLSDSEFIKSRLKLPANTYAYKLAGPLYIKKTLNTISNVTYNVYALDVVDDSGDTKYKIILDIFYEYNCPDLVFYGLKRLDSVNEGKYATYEDDYLYLDNDDTNSNPYLIGSYIDIVEYHNENILDINWKEVEELDIKDSFRLKEAPYKYVKYDPATNIYKANKIYESDNIVDLNSLCAIMLVPLTSNGLGIRNLSFLDIKDISKLKTTDIKLSTYLFKKETIDGKDYMCIKVGFTGYTAGKGAIKNRKVIISGTDSLNNNEYFKDDNGEYYKDDLGNPIIKEFSFSDDVGVNGSQEFYLELTEELKRRILLVTISWDVDTAYTLTSYELSRPFYDEDEPLPSTTEPINESTTESTTPNETISPGPIYRWIITTDLLNDFYGVVEDYGDNNSANFKNRFKIELEPTNVNLENYEVNSGSFTTGGQIFSTTAGKSKIIYGQSKTLTINDAKVELKLSDSYPEEIITDFKINTNNKSVELKTFKGNNQIELATNINNYGNKCNYLLKEYNEYKTTGFDPSIFNFYYGEDNKVHINYNGTFLILEFIEGEYEKCYNVPAKYLFKSIFETELTEKKLFDQCGSVGVYADTDKDDKYRHQINFTFLQRPSSGSVHNILDNKSSYPYRKGFYWDKNTSLDESHHFEIDSGVNDNDRTTYNFDDIYTFVLNNNKFDNYIDLYSDKNKFYFNFDNKNFFIGTTEQDMSLSFPTASPLRFASLNYIESFEDIDENFKPIMLWMRIYDDGNNNKWAIMPLRTPYHIIYPYVDDNLSIAEIHNRAVAGINNVNYGYIGKRTPTNLEIIEYLKTRIKNFFYAYEENAIIPEIFKLNPDNISQVNIDEEIYLKLTLGIGLNITVEEKLSNVLKKAGFDKIFESNSGNKTYNVIKDLNISDTEEGGITTNTNIPKLNINEIRDSEISFILLDSGKYYLNPPGLTFLNNDDKSIFIKNNLTNLFERVSNNSFHIADVHKDKDGKLFPMFTEQRGKSGIGILSANSGSHKTSIKFDFNTSNITSNIFDEAEPLFAENLPCIIPKELLFDYSNDYELILINPEYINNYHLVFREYFKFNNKTTFFENAVKRYISDYKKLIIKINLGYTATLKELEFKNTVEWYIDEGLLTNLDLYEIIEDSNE